MTDLRVVAVIKALSGSESIVGGALAALVEPTRGEDGCVSYELFTSAADPATFVTIETWRSQADLDGHMQSAHIQQAFAAAGEHLAGAPEISPLVPVG